VPLLYATLFGRWQRTKVASALLAVLFAASFLVYCRLDMEMNGPGGYVATPMLWKLVFVTLLPHLWMFLLGIAIHRHFGSLTKWLEGKFTYYLAAYVLCLVISKTWFPDQSVPFYAFHLPTRVLLALATISAAYSLRGLSGRLLGGTDVSYGVYIYHSIVINVLVELGQMSSLLSVIWVLLITGTLAWLSWTCIEKPALARKSVSLSGIWRRMTRRAGAWS
jgi:peptidoglycan/LPS O-acetylase OafA/YrhL